MRCPSPQEFQQRVAHLLEAQAPLDFAPVVSGHRHRALVPQEIRSVEQIDMQGVALDPLRAVEQPAEHADLRTGPDPQSRFQRMDSAHLVSHRTDPADARGNVGHFLEMAPAQESFKKAGRLEDVQLDVAQFPALGANIEATFTFHPCEVFNLNGLGAFCSVVGHNGHHLSLFVANVESR